MVAASHLKNSAPGSVEVDTHFQRPHCLCRLRLRCLCCVNSLQPRVNLRIPDSYQGTCIPLTLIRVPAYPWHRLRYLHTPDSDQGTSIPLTLIRAPEHPWHWSGCLHTLTLIRAPEYPGHWSGCLHTLTLIRAPEYPWHWSGHLNTPDTDQGACIPWHWSGYVWRLHSSPIHYFQSNQRPGTAYLRLRRCRSWSGFLCKRVIVIQAWVGRSRSLL